MRSIVPDGSSRCRRNFVYGQISTHILFLGILTDTEKYLEPTINDDSSNQGDGHPEQGSSQLCSKSCGQLRIAMHPFLHLFWKFMCAGFQQEIRHYFNSLFQIAFYSFTYGSCAHNQYAKKCTAQHWCHRPAFKNSLLVILCRKSDDVTLNQGC